MFVLHLILIYLDIQIRDAQMHYTGVNLCLNQPLNIRI